MLIIETRFCKICGRSFEVELSFIEEFNKKIEKLFPKVSESDMHKLCAKHKLEKYYPYIAKAYMLGYISGEDIAALGININYLHKMIREDYKERRIERKGFWMFPYDEYQCINCGLRFSSNTFRHVTCCPRCGKEI